MYFGRTSVIVLHLEIDFKAILNGLKVLKYISSVGNLRFLVLEVDIYKSFYSLYPLSVKQPTTFNRGLYLKICDVATGENLAIYQALTWEGGGAVLI